MRRAPVLIICAAASFAALTTPANAEGGSVLARGPAVAKVGFCDRDAGEAVFVGRMKRVPRTARMAMRFTIEERRGDTAWGTADARALKRFRRSRPGVRRFVYRQRVRGLMPGSSYRAVIHFRWYDADGRVVKRARRRSRACRRPGPLPNLRAVRVSAKHRTAAPPLYRVRVINFGNDVAGPFDVRLVVDGVEAGAATVARLGPGEGRTVELPGPPCVYGVEAEVDPTEAVAEANERDNVLALGCPPLS